MSSRAAPGAALLLAIGLTPGVAHAADPIGYLDGVSCEGMSGWAQDPDAPDAPIDVHVYFGGPAGTPGAPAIATRAGIHRDDLCAAIGSCEHGYLVRSPYSLHDGLPHPIHAYGIDDAGVNNPQLANSPRELVCAPAASGFRRKITSSGAFDRWRFESFWDVLPLDAATATALPEGPDFPEQPELVTLESTPDDVWVVDGGVRRPLTVEVAASWRIDRADVTVVADDDLAALVEGPPLRGRPLLFIAGGLWLVDDELPDAPPPDGSSSAVAGGGANEGGSGGAAEGGAGSDGEAGPGGSPPGEAAGGDDAATTGSSSGCQLAGGVGSPARSAALLLIAACVGGAGWRRRATTKAARVGGLHRVRRR